MIGIHLTNACDVVGARGSQLVRLGSPLPRSALRSAPFNAERVGRECMSTTMAASTGSFEETEVTVKADPELGSVRTPCFSSL